MADHELRVAKTKSHLLCKGRVANGNLNRTQSTASPYFSCKITKPRQIRVLDVAAQQTPLFDDEPLRGLLRTVELDQYPRFDALSYVWGSKTKPSPVIECGISRIDVTENCYAALWHLRKRLGGFTIWIDAICINQADDAEKARQIPLMRDVFTRARTVFVWLGSGTEATNRAMRALPALELLDYFFQDRRNEEQCHVKPQSLMALFTVYLNLLSTDRRGFLRFTTQLQALEVTSNDLSELFSSSWLTRIWTYQEIILATNPVIVCGTEFATWDDMIFGAFFLSWAKSGMDNIHSTSDIKLVNAAVPWQRLAKTRSEHRLNKRLAIHANVYSDQADVLQRYQDFLLRISSNSRLPSHCVLCACISGALVYAVWIYLYVLSSRNSPLALTTALVHLWPLSVSLAFMVVLTTAQLPQVNPILTKFHGWYAGENTSSAVDGLIHALRTRTASVEKDFNFGTEAVCQLLSSEALPCPAYHVSDLEAYLNLSIRMLQLAPFAYVVLAGALTAAPDHPSWVPVWSRKIYWSWDNFLREVTTRETLAPASSRLQSHWRFDLTPQPNIMVNGVEVGHIVHIKKVSFTQNTANLDWAFLLATRQDHMHNLAVMHHLFDPSFESSKILSMPHLRQKDGLADWTDVSAMYSRVCAFKKGDLLRTLGNIGHEPTEEARSNTEMAILQRYDELSFCVAMCNRLANSDSVVIDVSVNGDRSPPKVGIASNKVRVGDKIMMMAGIATPVIMRDLHTPPLRSNRAIPSTERASASQNSRIMRVISPSGIFGMSSFSQWRKGDDSDIQLITIV